MPLPSTMTPIATSYLASAASSVTFSNIPQTYSDLYLVCSTKAASANGSFLCRVGNGSVDTGSNYYFNVLEATSSVIRAAGAGGPETFGFLTGFWAMITNGNDVFVTSHFNNYSSTSQLKTWLSRGNIPSQWTDMSVSTWNSTSAINVISIVWNTASTLAAGSTVSLYGIKAAS